MVQGHFGDDVNQSFPRMSSRNVNYHPNPLLRPSIPAAVSIQIQEAEQTANDWRNWKMPGLTAPSDYSQEPPRHPALLINSTVRNNNSSVSLHPFLDASLIVHTLFFSFEENFQFLKPLRTENLSFLILNI